MEGYQKRFEQWKQALSNTDFQGDINALLNDEQLRSDSFYKDLEFGTAGMRGIIGIGTNRMNIFTVRRATQAVAKHINKTGNAHKGVAIAYDTRKNSDIFAKETAEVLLANGIKVYMYQTAHSVPQLSFAILQLSCAAGIVITASHNPPEYNGYKVYGEDGGQITVSDSDLITEYMAEVDEFNVETMPIENAENFNWIGEALDTTYNNMVQALSINKDVINSQADSLSIVYTPLHGTGLAPVSRVLKSLGIKNLHIVAEQEAPDPAFPTVSAPNPENRECFDLAIKLADKVSANLILATDPDSDRLGAAVRDKDNNFVVLTGNEIGCLLLDYILSQKQSAFKGDEFAAKSIVSTDMADVIAKHYGVSLRGVYTGFKNIAEQIQQSEIEKSGTFLFGFEESYGYLIGSFVRDKDAIQGAMMLVEAACYYAEQGKTLYDAVVSLYEKYGWFKEIVVSKTLYGQEGIAKIMQIVQTLRDNPPTKIGEFEVVKMYDYEKQIIADLKANTTSDLLMPPPTNVLSFELKNGRVIVRPSGTEPKLKTYISYFDKDDVSATEGANKLNDTVCALIDSL